MPILVDATVLSNLAAIGRLDLLNLLRAPLYLASAAYEEIQQGLAEGYEFLANVDNALDSGLLSLITIESDVELQRYREIPDKLHRGEAMSLAVAQCRGWRFLTDDRAARTHAEHLGVPFSGTLGLFLYAVRNGHLTIEEGNELLAKMIDLARYRSPVSDLRLLLEEGEA